MNNNDEPLPIKWLRQNQKLLIISMILAIAVFALYLSYMKTLAEIGTIYQIDIKTPQNETSQATESVEDLIVAVSREKGYNDPNYAIALTYCESRHNPEATGTNTNGTIDRGLWQINNYWHKEVNDSCAYDAKCSTEWAIDMLMAGQAHQWTCSKLI